MPVQVPFETAYLLQQLLNALQIGAFYGLLAASYALVYGITRRINFAFGAIGTFGAAACFNVVVLVGFLWPVPTAAAILIAGAYATAASALLGTAMERLVIRPVAHAANLSMLVTTIALTISVEGGDPARQRLLRALAAADDAVFRDGRGGTGLSRPRHGEPDDRRADRPGGGAGGSSPSSPATRSGGCGGRARRIRAPPNCSASTSPGCGRRPSRSPPAPPASPAC
jgi:hypothetical protein